MARNQLTRSAKALSDLVMDKSYKQKQVDLADKMNCDPSTLCRLTSGDGTVQTFNLIGALNLGLYDKETHIAISKQEFEILLLSLNGIDERLREKYLDK